MSWPRTLLGFIIGPLAPGVVLMGGVAFAYGQAGAALSMLFVSAALGYPAAMLVGAPMYVLFRRWGWNGWLTYLIAGPGLGLAASAGWILSKRMGDWLGLVRDTHSMPPLFVAAVMLCGTVATLCFWLIARPDRSAKDREPTAAL